MKEKLIKAAFMSTPLGLLNTLADYVAGSTPTKGDLERKTIDDLKELAMRQGIEMEMTKDRAKVAQELAIAERIQVAEEVDIEEYYDVSAKGGVGLEASENSLNFGLSGSGTKVSKRIYKFRGFRDFYSESNASEEP
ncbi:hypothetical protein [Paenalcaligenes suwonensis]|uniref:hypothetical protein n=1 Tax=Paenalcaligenes suwonensis TaxID=1202713 RepID=UPI0014085C21|nr:hypothetical protein [Paenalcaligenes suwonensis]NHC62907.1 hypothetical protein [Paenalcaligenes suwonensis]